MGRAGIELASQAATNCTKLKSAATAADRRCNELQRVAPDGDKPVRTSVRTSVGESANGGSGTAIEKFDDRDPPIRAEVATYWVRSPRNRFPLVIILPRLAWLRRFGELAFAVGRHASSPEFDRTFDHGSLLAAQRCRRSPSFTLRRS